MTDQYEHQAEPEAKPVDETITDAVRRGREAVAVLPGEGLSPDQMAQLVDVALTMAKARHAIPAHLKGNPGDCFAIINMAVRNGLNPYMVAQYTYVQNDRLCLMSVLYHSLAIASGYLIGPLRDEYEGEGEDLVCTVSGRIRGEPLPYVMRSEPLKALHPGHTTKEKDGVRQRFTKGSPLWDKDPKTQLFYHTSRNWVRKYAPLAILGGMVPEHEIDDYVEGAPPPGLIERLGGERPQTGEGFRDGAHLNAELARIAPNEPPGESQVESLPESSEEPEPPRERHRPARRVAARKPKARKGIRKPVARKTAQRAPEPAPETKAKGDRFYREKPKAPQPKPPTAKVVQAAADRAENPPAPKPAKRLRWHDYVTQTEEWISAATDGSKAEERWEAEFDMRDELMVPIAERTRLRQILDGKIEKLGGKR